jgi:hypothetical protein
MRMCSPPNSIPMTESGKIRSANPCFSEKSLRSPWGRRENILELISKNYDTTKK